LSCICLNTKTQIMKKSSQKASDLRMTIEKCCLDQYIARGDYERISRIYEKKYGKKFHFDYVRKVWVGERSHDMILELAVEYLMGKRALEKALVNL